MGRYRPPQQPGSQYITPEGARRLQEELDELWKHERPKVTQAVSEAAAQGDRSENAEYIYGKRRLRQIERLRPKPKQQLVALIDTFIAAAANSPQSRQRSRS